jgi:hexosaminidase
MSDFPSTGRRFPRQRLFLALAALATAAAVAFVTAPAASAAPVGEHAATGGGAPVNLALTGTASASSVELDRADFAASMAIDGDASTRFSSGYDDDAWFQVKLAAPSPVDHIVINWPNACAKSFIVQTSTDGSTWTDRKTFTDESTCPRVDTIQLGITDPVSYVRMQGQKRWSTYGYSISEFEVYAAPTPKQLALVPEPVSVERGDGDFSITSTTQVEASGDALQPATQLATQLRTATGYDIPVVAKANAADPIRFVIADGEAPAGHADEGYTLKVASDSVRIGADTAHGALDAVQTLRQLAPEWIDSDHAVDVPWTIPVVSISDYPRFAYRGLMIDTARSFYTVDEVEKLISEAARYKIDAVHLHLTDDQGWRIAMDTPKDDPSGIDYSLLTSVSGSTAMTKNDQGQQMGTELGHTGFYTKSDYKEIVDFAAENGVTIVPEIDMPAHTNAALHAIPQLNGGGSAPAPTSGEPTVPANGSPDVGYSGLGADNPVTYEFVEQVLSQLAAMTPGPYVHVGGDEAAVISSSDYTKMVNAATADVTADGKTVIGWNEYAGTDLPDGAVVQYWNGSSAAIASAVQNHDAKVILSPASKAYYPQKQDNAQPQGGTWACGGACTLENAYAWDPATTISGVDESHVLGVEGAVWGEFIRGVSQAEYYAFPRLLATAEVGWSAQSDRNTSQFLDRVAQLGGSMQLQGVNFFPTATVDWAVQVAGAVDGSSGATATVRTAADVTAVTDDTTSTSVDWTVTAPGGSTDDLTAMISWDGQDATPVSLAGTSVADIAAMTLNSPFTATTTADLAPGDHTAVLAVTPENGAAVTATVSLTVPSATDPGDGDGGGSTGGDDGGQTDTGDSGAGGAGTGSGQPGAGQSGTAGDVASTGDPASLASTGSSIDAALAGSGAVLVLGVVFTLLGTRRRRRV